ncbi:MAG: hypothetical protein ACRCT2_15355, partial [Plesiomonas shigelloides]
MRRTVIPLSSAAFPQVDLRRANAGSTAGRRTNTLGSPLVAGGRSLCSPSGRTDDDRLALMPPTVVPLKTGEHAES